MMWQLLSATSLVACACACVFGHTGVIFYAWLIAFSALIVCLLSRERNCKALTRQPWNRIIEWFGTSPVKQILISFFFFFVYKFYWILLISTQTRAWIIHFVFWLIVFECKTVDANWLLPLFGTADHTRRRDKWESDDCAGCGVPGGTRAGTRLSSMGRWMWWSLLRDQFDFLALFQMLTQMLQVDVAFFVLKDARTFTTMVMRIVARIQCANLHADECLLMLFYSMTRETPSTGETFLALGTLYTHVYMW